jgi:hypothetical protein
VGRSGCDATEFYPMSWYQRLLWVATLGLSRKLDDLFALVQAQGVSIMAAFDEMKAELATINVTTNELAEDLDDVIAKLAAATGGVLTPEQAAEIVDDLKATSEGLKAVAAKWTPET